MKPIHFSALAGVLASGLSLSAANATILTYNSFTHAGGDVVDYVVTIDDSTAGQFQITYGVASGSPNTVGKLTGFFFDIGPINTATLPDPDSADPPYINAATLGLSGESNPSGTTSCGQAFGDVNQVTAGGGCNSTLNLGTTIIGGIDYAGFLFDVGIAWTVNDLSSGATGTFSILSQGLTLNDWGAIGLRGQATTGTEGSAKEFQLVGSRDPLPPAQIPEPGIIALFGTGLIGMGIAARRRRHR